MIYLGSNSFNLWLYAYSERYGYIPNIISFNTWKEIIDVYRLPPKFGQEEKEIILGKIPLKLLSSTTKKDLGKNINLKKELQKDLDYRELILITELKSKEDTNTFNNFLHKQKTWVKYLDNNPPEVSNLFNVLYKVFTPEAYKWLINTHKNYPTRIKEELSWWAYKFNTTKKLIDINQVRQDLGEYEENTERYCNHIGSIKGNEILMNMKSSNIWATFFSINEYKSPIDIYIERYCPSLITSLYTFKYSVENQCVNVKEGALILNSWWGSVIESKKVKPWKIIQNADSLRNLNKALRVQFK